MIFPGQVLTYSSHFSWFCKSSDLLKLISLTDSADACLHSRIWGQDDSLHWILQPRIRCTTADILLRINSFYFWALLHVRSRFFNASQSIVHVTSLTTYWVTMQFLLALFTLVVASLIVAVSSPRVRAAESLVKISTSNPVHLVLSSI